MLSGNRKNLGVELSFSMQEIKRCRKVSTHVSLCGLRRLTWVDTFRKCFKSPLHIVWVKGGYLGFSHLVELRNINSTDIYMKKQYKSSRIKNHKITKKKKKKKKKNDGVP